MVQDLGVKLTLIIKINNIKPSANGSTSFSWPQTARKKNCIHRRNVELKMSEEHEAELTVTVDNIRAKL